MGLIDSVVEEHSTSFGSVSALTALGSSFLELEDSVSTKYEGRAETLHNQQTGTIESPPSTRHQGTTF